MTRRDPVELLDEAIRHDPSVLMQVMRQEPEEPAPPLLTRLTVADVQTNPPPPPSYAWEGLVPTGHVTLLSAHGGVGKSTIALMLCVAAALNRPLFGIPTNAGNALFVSLEDSGSVVRHRLAWITKAWSLNPAELDRRLAIVDGTDHPEMFTSTGRADAGFTTGTYDEMAELVETEGFGLIVIDNASDAFDGDEIQRRQVRAFMRSLSRLARHTGCAILLLAHVDKGTSRANQVENDEGYSGSTAWHNSSRSRLYLRRKSGDLLALIHQKNNLGRRCEPLELIWPEGGLPTAARPDDPFQARVRAREADDRAAALLRLIAEFEDRGFFCSPEPTAKNNVHAVLRGDPAFDAMRLTRDDTKAAVMQCSRAQWLDVENYRTEHRKEARRWTVTKLGRDFAGITAPSAPSAPSQETAQ